MFVTSDWLIKVLLFVAAYQVFYSSAEDSIASCHGECGDAGTCAGDHYCSLSRGEPFCRPCSDIGDHYCHNLTYIKDKFSQCLYYCHAEKKVKELEQQQLKTMKTAQTDVPIIVMCLLLLVAVSAAFIFAFLYCRERRKRTVSVSREPEGQPLVTTVSPNSDTSHKEVEVEMKTHLGAPASHSPTQPDVGYETASSSASLNSTATDNGSSTLQPVQQGCSNEDRSTNPGHGGQTVSVCDVTIRPDSQNTKLSILNNPTSEDRKYDRNVATSVSRHREDDV